MVQTQTPLSGHLDPIVRAVADGRIEACALHPHDIADARARARIPTRRAILIVADDYAVSRGPGGFDTGTVRWFLARSTAVAVMAGAPVAVVYKRAVEAAIAGAFVVLVECQEHTQGSWMATVDRWAPRAALLMAVPRPAGALVH